MTNREYLFSLPDEELGALLCSWSQCAIQCPVNRVCYWDSDGRHNGFVHWLQTQHAGQEQPKGVTESETE